MAARTDSVLIVDDDALVGQAYHSILTAAGWTDSLVVTDPRIVMDLVRRTSFAAILLDLHMPHIPGRQLLVEIAAERPEIPVLVLTLEDSVDVAVECMRIGAFDFMTKPIDENRLVSSVARAVQFRSLHDEIRVLSRRGRDIELTHPELFSPIVTSSEAIHQLFVYVETIASSPRAVLITGESGTGKELFARATHDASGRRGSFVPVNVAGLDETVFSDTLFGHRRGAFTGADATRRGLVEQAASGTLFLDEIGDLDNGAQVKLLRLLQEEEYYPLGSDVAERSTARVIAATNADLFERQKAGTFRRDLFYRLMGHHLEIPPLRDRPEDIVVLVAHFVAQSYEVLGRPACEPPPGVHRVFDGYTFPGNVRELQGIIFDVVSRAGGRAVQVEDFRAHPQVVRHAADRRTHESTPGAAADRPMSKFSYIGELPTLEEATAFLVREALARAKGNQTIAARTLGVSQSTLSRRLARSPRQDDIS